MNIAKYILSLILLATSVLPLAAQVKVQVPSTVGVGETFQLRYTIEGANGQLVSPPHIDGARLVNTSRVSSNFNGKSSSEIVFMFIAETPGTHKLEGATIAVNGRRYSTSARTIYFDPNGGGSSNPSSGGGSSASPFPNGNPFSGSQGGTVGNISASDLFARIVLSKEVVYEQEAVVCTIKLFSRVEGNISFSCTQQPSFNGFLIEELPVNRNSQHLETFNGKSYMVADVMKYILFPQESGKLTITPGKYEAAISVDPFGGFFGPSSTTKVNVPASPAVIDVRRLPSPRPANFSGAVGTFTVSTRINPQAFKTYAPATYSIIVTGSGNLKYIQNPIVNMPKQFDTYDPQSNINVAPSGDNVSGSVTFNYLFIPQFVGDFKIPDSYFVYFNTTTQQYDSLKIEGYKLSVAKGEGKPSKHYALRNLDIRGIDKGKASIAKSQSFFITSLGYWLLALFLLIAMIAGLIIYRKIEATHADSSLMRKRRASKLAQRRLKTARQHMESNDRNGFYSETLSALWGYLSDKLSIPVSELSKDNIAAEMEAYGFEPKHIGDTMHMLETCEFAQYAPELESNTMAQVYNDSATLIDELESVKRKKETPPDDDNDNNIIMRAITLLITVTAMALTTMAAPVDYVEQGNKAYDAKQYKEAVKLYTQATTQGSSSQLYYNMGNAYYRLNDRANAILCYEKAIKLSPSNSDARYNLQFVREKSQLVDDNGATYFSSLIGDWVSHASSNTWAVIGMIAFALMLAGFACFRIAPTVVWQKVGFFGAIVMAVITILAIICSFYMHSRCTSNDYAIIMVDKSVAQKSPRKSDKDVAFRLTNGVKVQITDSISEKDTKQKWYKIETADSRSGWMKKDNFEII